MEGSELEISRTGVKVARIGPLAVIVVVALVGETVVSLATITAGTEFAWKVWGGFSLIVGAVVGYPLVALVARALLPGAAPPG